MRLTTSALHVLPAQSTALQLPTSREQIQPRGISRRLSHRLRGDPKGPLFRTIDRATRQLTGMMLPQANAYAMIGRRATAAGIATKLSNYSFQATVITACLKAAACSKGPRRWRTMPRRAPRSSMIASATR
jgi:hypothetical protein